MRPLALLSLLSACADLTTTEAVDDVTLTTVRRSYANVHVLQRGDTTVMVDAGFADDAARLDAGLRRAGLDPEGFAAVVVTHGHSDHAGGAAWFHERYGLPRVAGAADAPGLGRGRNDPDTLCPTDATGRARLDDTLADRFPAWAPELGVEAPHDLGDGVRVHPLPGHTDGSVVVVAGAVAAVGDLFRGGIASAGAHVHFYQCDLADNRADVRALLDQVAPGATRFAPGHFATQDRDAVEALWSRGYDERQ